MQKSNNPFNRMPRRVMVCASVATLLAQTTPHSRHRLRVCWIDLGVKVLRIAQITDLHIDSEDDQLLSIDSRERTSIILERLKSLDIDLLVLTGDISETTGLTWLFSELKKLGIEYYIAFGNHDKPDQYNEFCHFQNSSQPYFYFDSDGFRLMFLNSSSTVIDSDQLEWLKASLDNTKRVVVFIHHPVLDCGNTVMDQKYPLINRNEVKKVLSNYGSNVLIFSGHYHHEYTISNANIDQFVTPSTTVQIRPFGKELDFDISNIGFRLIELDKCNYSTQVVRIEVNNPTIAST